MNLRYSFYPILFVILALATVSFGQTEVITNNEVILMTRAGLTQEIVLRKITDSDTRFDTRAEALIELKKAGVSDDVIKMMLDKANGRQTVPERSYSDSTDPVIFNQSYSNADARIKINPNEALRSARTIALEKSSVHPSRQALEKELLKRKEWTNLNLNIVRYKEDADLYVEIGFVPFSVLTHRYAWRVYDTKSGTVIAAGETTSWGSLAKNLARDITKQLNAELN